MGELRNVIFFERTEDLLSKEKNYNENESYGNFSSFDMQ